MSLVGAEAQSADKEPRTVNISLRPQDAHLLEGLSLEGRCSIAVEGEVTSLSFGEYGCNLCIEVDSAGLAIQKPEPKKFVDQMENMKVLKG